MARVTVATIAVALLAVTASRARADDLPPVDPPTPALVDAPDDPAPPADDDVSAARRAAAIAAAIVPGAVVHGAGAYVLGDHATTKHLLLMEAIGIAAAGLGAALVQGSRGSEYTVEPGVPLLIAGAGLILPSWFDDLWVAAGGTRSRGTAIGAPPWSLELGTTYMNDAYRRRGLVRAAATVDVGRFGFAAGAYLDSDNQSRTGDLEVRYLIAGDPTRSRAIADGSRLVARAAVRYLRDDPDMFSTDTVEGELIGRLALSHVDPLLAGTFAEVSTGFGVDRVNYSTGAHDHDTLLLGTFAWGMYLGARGEWTVFYDHRRDGLAGGFDAWRGAGFVGSFGSQATVRISGPWAARAEMQFGNAMLTTLALQYRGGE
jgi:hypothetical protein